MNKEKHENSIQAITIQGFKSIRNLENFELKNLNVLIGANGSGKSNLVSFFHFLQCVKNKTVESFYRDNGGIDNLLHNGPKHTNLMYFQTHGKNTDWKTGIYANPGHKLGFELDPLYEQKLPICQIYHINDTTITAKLRRYEIIQDNSYLRSNGSNIAPFLLYLRNYHPYEYKLIGNAIRLVIPFFGDFLLKVEKLGQNGEQEQINLSWTQKGSDFPMQPYHLSDGSMRFICLATALLQAEPPSIIVIDEPELGLHPEAIAILAELIENAAERTQLIVTTQSPTLIDHFDIENIVVVERKNGESQFSRLNKDDFSVWLNEYSLGDLWRRNIIRAGSTNE